MHLFVLFALVVATTAHLDWYDFDGGNNHHNPKWGVAGDEIIRHSPHLSFAEHYSHHSPRYISNLIADADKEDDRDNPRNISSILTLWGQFVDHDMVYTLEGEDPWPIEIPKCDKYFDPHCEGHRVIPFIRSAGDKKHRTNRVTSFIDGSPIYGSSYEVSEILREWKGGRLKVSHEVHDYDGEFPPFVYELDKKAQELLAMENNADHADNEHMWVMGDVRANQHPLLFALHTLFWREHNRVAHILEHHNHHWDDQQIFNAARKYVIAEIQHITFNEFLYWLLARPFPEKDYYDPHCDPRVHDFFATVAFRYGHSEVADMIKKSVKGHYGEFPLWSYSQLHEHFFDSEFILHADLGSLFEGLAYQKQKSPDAYMSPVIRNQLFRGEFPHHHFDLFAIDIQRGRDHCIPSFNHARKAYGLEPYDSWHDFDAIDERVGQNLHELKSDLAKAYRNPWEADAIVGGVASDWVRTPYTEHHHDYSNVGDLFESAIISQFQRTRVGDRFWYSRNLDEINCHGLEPVQHRTLAKIIRDNVKGCNIPDDIFKVWY